MFSQTGTLFPNLSSLEELRVAWDWQESDVDRFSKAWLIHIKDLDS